MDYEKMPLEELSEEARVLNAEIEALQTTLRKIENEIFYKQHPECRPT